MYSNSRVVFATFGLRLNLLCIVIKLYGGQSSNICFFSFFHLAYSDVSYSSSSLQLSTKRKGRGDTERSAFRGICLLKIQMRFALVV